jgi:heptosyltransferase-2
LTRLYVSRKSTEKQKRIPESSLEIRANKYDLLIDAYSKLSWLVVLLSGAKEAYLIGRTFLYTDNVPFEELPKTNLGLAIERRLSLLDPSLTGKMDPLPKLFVTPKKINMLWRF